MKLSKKTQAAIKAKAAITKGTKAGKVVKLKQESTSVYAWKQIKKAGADRLLGHGGFYNLRADDAVGSIVGAMAKGASKRLVAIFSGAFGVCFADGAFVGKVMNVGGIGIDTSKIRKVLFFGSVEGAAAYVKNKGEKATAVACHYEDASHVLGAGERYTVALIGKSRLVRDEHKTSANGAAFVKRES